MPFLALIPARIWAELAGALVLLAGFGWYTIHERHLGAQHEAAQVAAVTKQAEDKRAADLAAQAKIDQANLQKVSDDYQTQLDASQRNNAVLAQRLQDYYASRRGLAVPGTAATPAESDGPTREPSGVEVAVGRVIEAAGHDADQVIALQNYITAECR